MQKLTKSTFKLIKTDDGNWINTNLKKLEKIMDQMAPGIYRLTIEKESTRLTKMKKFYFQMETNLAHHLGMKKPELHEALKEVFLKFDIDKDELVYDSVADIKEEEEMMARILEFQQYAALKHNYTTEPFSED